MRQRRINTNVSKLQLLVNVIFVNCYKLLVKNYMLINAAKGVGKLSDLLTR